MGKHSSSQIGHSSFSFILNPVNAAFPVPHHLTSHFSLDIPSEYESTLIDQFLDRINAFHGPYTSFKPSPTSHALDDRYHSAIQDNEYFNPPIVGEIIDPDPDILDKHAVRQIDLKWDYYIIRATPDASFRDLQVLHDALLVAQPSIFVGASFEEMGGRDYLTKTDRFYHDYPLMMCYSRGKARPKDYVESLSEDDLLGFAHVFRLISNFNEDSFPFIDIAISEYRNSLIIPKSSSLILLGLFSILELLLCHDSRESGAPSISWQLSKKLPFVNSQLDHPIDFQKHFHCGRDVPDETIVERLYRKRCLVAHATEGDFSSKLQIISKGDEISFLREIVRGIIRLGLSQPQFLVYLKSC